MDVKEKREIYGVFISVNVKEGTRSCYNVCLICMYVCVGGLRLTGRHRERGGFM